MDREAMSNKVTRILHEAHERRVFPGAVAGIADEDGIQCVVAAGSPTYESSMRVTADTVFDVASITKAVPVSSGVLRLVEKGVMEVSDPLVRYVPEYSGDYAEEIRIHHLLTHTLHFGYRLSTLAHLPGEQILQAILRGKLSSPPGATYSYANATSILLGICLERAAGRDLEEFSRGEFFEPIGMDATTFFPGQTLIHRIPPTEKDERGMTIQGQVHDESARALRPRAVGSAGLFTTAGDLLLFMSSLLRSGNGGIFTPEMLERIGTNQVSMPDARTGLGWELNQRRFMGRNCSGKTIGKTGFTGCSCAADLVRRRAVVLLSNHTFPRRQANREDIDSVRSAVADVAWGA